MIYAVMSATPVYDSLKPKERIFVDAYIQYSFNATLAAKAVGLKQPRFLGCRWLTKVNIKAAIEERLEQAGVTKAMVKCRLAEQAFSSLGDLISFDPQKGPHLDLQKARRLRRLHLLAKLKQRTYFDKSKQAHVTEIEVENYSAQAALFKLDDHFNKQEAPKNDNKPSGIARIPLRGQQTENAWSDAANSLEPTA